MVGWRVAKAHYVLVGYQSTRKRDGSLKVISYTALLYGKDYLGYAIRSVIDHVEEHHILYSPIGAHGHRTDTPCPETRDELYAIAQSAAGDKLRWHDGNWEHEGLQRDSIFEYAPDADVILVVDADEIWPSGLARNMTDGIDYGFFPRNVRLPMIHMWRSFWKGILHDPAHPIRVICPKKNEGELNFSDLVGHIVHLGYAQRPEIVNYKQLTHGHKGEWRKDIDWFNERFMNPAAVTDLHPVGSEYWNVETVNPLDYLPPFMAMHPYFDKDVIE